MTWLEYKFSDWVEIETDENSISRFRILLVFLGNIFNSKEIIKRKRTQRWSKSTGCFHELPWVNHLLVLVKLLPPDNSKLSASIHFLQSNEKLAGIKTRMTNSIVYGLNHGSNGYRNTKHLQIEIVDTHNSARLRCVSPAGAKNTWTPFWGVTPHTSRPRCLTHPLGRSGVIMWAKPASPSAASPQPQWPAGDWAWDPGQATETQA